MFKQKISYLTGSCGLNEQRMIYKGAMKDVLIVGAGPAGLFAADRLSTAGLAVHIIDRMPSPARKLLMAGRGGLNITHSEDLTQFKGRYRAAEAFIGPMIDGFTPEQLREWCTGLGIETFVGSSGRVFPRAMKASPLLRALLKRLNENGVTLQTLCTWQGISPDGANEIVTSAGEKFEMRPRATLLALGGASWPRLGSDAGWVSALERHGVSIHPFKPANCGFQVNWSNHLVERFAGTPLKRIRLLHNGRDVLGEAVISAKGLEGGAIYTLSAELRDTLKREGQAGLTIDLTPQQSYKKLQARLSKGRGKQSLSNYLRKAAGLSPAEIALLREAGPMPDAPADLARRIKALPIAVIAPYDIDHAISSAGGIALEEVDKYLMLRKLPGVFAAGEMLDWEAPTGGYLLQACFSMAERAAEGITRYLNSEKGTAEA